MDWFILIAPFFALLGMILWDARNEPRADPKFFAETALAFALLFVAAGQFIVGSRQATIMDKQADISLAQTRISIADQRPWIRPSILGFENIEIGDLRSSAGVKMQFKNFGKTPAIQLHPVVSWGALSAADRRNEQRLLCKMADIGISDTSPTIYPDGDYQLGLSDSQGAAAYLTKWGNGPEQYIAPELYGCVAYKTAIDDAIHHTRFAYALRRRDDLAGGFNLIRWSGPTTVPAQELAMQISPFGYNDAD